MVKKHNREKQTAVLRKAQEKRKQEKREQLFRAIEEIQKSGKPLTFTNIAKVAGCSVSYLYKWTELTAYIHDLQEQKTQQLHQLEEKKPGSHSLKTLHEVSKQRIRQLEAENIELKRQNEMLRGHVAEIFELRDECQRLRTQLRQLNQPEPPPKVIPLHCANKIIEKTQIKETTKLSIEQELKQLGISLNSTLKKTISKATEENVVNAIKLLKYQLSKQDIPNPGGWLNKAIKDGWTKSEPIPRQTQQENSVSNQVKITPDKKLISADKLKSLSQSLNNIFKDNSNDK